MKKAFLIILALIIIAGAGYFFIRQEAEVTVSDFQTCVAAGQPVMEIYPRQCRYRGVTYDEKVADGLNQGQAHPMSIQALRDRRYPGGDFKIEQTLNNGTNYWQYIVSYLSEGLKIYGLLTVPTAPRPVNGFPAIIFIHGYINPKEYSTTGNYPTYQAALARGGFITFKPDLRGHGNSEGEATGAHFSPDYVVDTLNAIAYLKDYKDTDPERLGYWGHSNGGEIGLRAVVISPDIKAASFWAGVVGSYHDMLEIYNYKIGFLRRATSTELVRQYELPSANPAFWQKLDPYSCLGDITAAIELHHGTADQSVPIELSHRLKEELKKAGKQVELFEYPGDDHNIAKNSGLAWQRTINFFHKNLAITALPLDRVSERLTKKPFGILITKENSPIKNERFSGYHTGIDLEVFPQEIEQAVPVKAICTGELVLKRLVSGYGGTAVQKCELDGQPVTVLYGHLDLKSISSEAGQTIQAGEIFARLGADASTETDGERKHLHLEIHKGESVVLSGYIKIQPELSAWLDPCIYVCRE